MSDFKLDFKPHEPEIGETVIISTIEGTRHGVKIPAGQRGVVVRKCFALSIGPIVFHKYEIKLLSSGTLIKVWNSPKFIRPITDNKSV